MAYLTWTVKKLPIVWSNVSRVIRAYCGGAGPPYHFSRKPWKSIATVVLNANSAYIRVQNRGLTAIKPKPCPQPHLPPSQTFRRDARLRVPGHPTQCFLPQSDLKFHWEFACDLRILNLLIKKLENCWNVQKAPLAVFGLKTGLVELKTHNPRYLTTWIQVKQHSIHSDPSSECVFCPKKMKTHSYFVPHKTPSPPPTSLSCTRMRGS